MAQSQAILHEIRALFENPDLEQTAIGEAFRKAEDLARTGVSKAEEEFMQSDERVRIATHNMALHRDLPQAEFMRVYFAVDEPQQPQVKKALTPVQSKLYEAIALTLRQARDQADLELQHAKHTLDIMFGVAEYIEFVKEYLDVWQKDQSLAQGVPKLDLASIIDSGLMREIPFSQPPLPSLPLSLLSLPHPLILFVRLFEIRVGSRTRPRATRW